MSCFALGIDTGGTFTDGVVYDLEEGQRALWTTLYPAAAAFREHDPRDTQREHRLLLRVRDWSVEVAKRFLDR